MKMLLPHFQLKRDHHRHIPVEIEPEIIITIVIVFVAIVVVPLYTSFPSFSPSRIADFRNIKISCVVSTMATEGFNG